MSISRDDLMSRLLKEIITGDIRADEKEKIDALLDHIEVPTEERKIWRTLAMAAAARQSGDYRLSINLLNGLSAKLKEPWFIAKVFQWLSRTRIMMSDVMSAESTLQEAMDRLPDPSILYPSMALVYYSREEIANAVNLLNGLSSESANMSTRLLTGVLSLIQGDFRKGAQVISGVLNEGMSPILPGAMEAMSLIRRVERDFQEARRLLAESVEIYMAKKNPYAIFPLNKWIDLAMFTEVEPPDMSLVAKVKRMANGSSPLILAALQELKAMIAWLDTSSEDALKEMSDAALALRRALQPLESFIGFVRTAYLSYRAKSSVFMKSVEYLAPRMKIYSFVDSDPVYGNFARTVLAGISAFETHPVRLAEVFLFGGMRTRALPGPSQWRSRKALLLFKYMLLNRGTGMPGDYLAYLLWPKRPPDMARRRLKQEIYRVRAKIGSLRELLVHKHGTYCIQEAPELFCDVNEFQALIREASALDSSPGQQLRNYLRALELYKGKLLPEDRYDPYIKEYRDHFHKRFCGILERAVQLLLEIGRQSEAVELAEGFYARFPKDDVVARIYMQLLVRIGRSAEAENLYNDFKRRLWREHRVKPSFRL